MIGIGAPLNTSPNFAKQKNFCKIFLNIFQHLSQKKTRPKRFLFFTRLNPFNAFFNLGHSIKAFLLKFLITYFRCKISKIKIIWQKF